MKLTVGITIWALATCAIHADPSEYVTFAHRVLLLESKIDDVPNNASKKIDSLINQTRARFGVVRPQNREHMRQFFRVIDEVLTANNFIFPPCRWTETLGDAFVPHRLSDKELEQVLARSSNRRRRTHIRAHRDEDFYFLDCDTGSFLYMGIAEAYGIHLDLVELPTHNFIRWSDFGDVPLNWDTNEAQEIKDEAYQLYNSITQEQIRRRLYLVSMTHEETMGYLWLIRAGRLLKLERHESTAAAFEEALRLARSTGATNDLAWHIATKPGFEARAAEAVDLAREAVSQHDTPSRRDTLACALALVGDLSEAIKIQERVVAADSSKGFRARLERFCRGQNCIGVVDDETECQ